MRENTGTWGRENGIAFEAENAPAEANLPARTADAEDYTYDVMDGQAIITQYRGTDNEVVIQEQLGGYPVIGIGEGAFEDCSELTGITILAGITYIGDRAFASCVMQALVSAYL